MNKIILFFACMLFISAGAFAQSSRFRFGASLYPNFSNSLQPVSDAVTRDYESGIFALSAGAFTEYVIKSDLKLQLGLSYSGPGYRIPKRPFTGVDGDDPLLPEQIKSRHITHCLEVPLNIIWHPEAGKRLFTTAGFSAFLPFAQTIVAKTYNNDGSNATIRRTNYDFKLGCGFQFGMGTTLKLSSSMEMDIVPELKIMQVDYTGSWLSQFLQAGVKLAVRV